MHDAPPLLQRLVAEVVGTFALVFAGCGAIMVDAQTGGSVGPVGVSLTFGLVIMVMVYAVGHISGAHFNPAVTIAFAAGRHFPIREAPAYIGAQVLGATLAAASLLALLGPLARLGSTVPVAGTTHAFAFEVVMTFFLMFVIAAVATDARAQGSMAGVAIGGTVALCALFGGPVTGASLNPARSLGPALIAGELGTIGPYVTAPVVGAVVAVWMYAYVARR